MHPKGSTFGMHFVSIVCNATFLITTTDILVYILTKQ